MDSRIRKLISYFEQNGWKLKGVSDKQNDWWFESIILLTSGWRPTGTTLYLTLLTDPMYTDSKVVWAVNVSSSLPEEKDFRTIRQITMNDIKRTDLTEFVKEINSVVLKT